VETQKPDRSEVSNVAFRDYQGDAMKIENYAQICSAIQLNKAILVLLEIRDNTKGTPQILEEIRAVRKNTNAIPQIALISKE
jgi:hypothetical protein